ncbi:MAG: hypothetical protein V3S06_06770, partial [candidate division Zixibacteria bacterium]
MKFKYLALLMLLVVFILALGCPKPPPPPPEPPPVVEPPPPPPEPPPPPPPPPPLELVTITFEFDMDNLTPEARDIIADNAKALADRSEAVIKFDGLCVERVSEFYILSLGDITGEFARDFFVNFVIELSRI